MAKNSFLITFFYIILLIITIGSINPCQIVAQDSKDINILSLIADGVGNTYFTVKDQFEEWGWDVTTVGLKDNHTGCPNKEPIFIASDILISEINNISQFDCVFIASGAQHHILRDNKSVLEFITTAYNEGLVISTLCVSTVILADADIINGTKVVGHPHYAYDIELAGGIFEVDAKIISDKRIVTGGRGGGPTGKCDLAAPTYELCVAIAKEILGYSYVIKTSLTPTSEDLNTNFQISVETVNLTDLPYNIAASGISQVTANIHQNNNFTVVEEVELKLGNNKYLGNFTAMKIGEYNIVIEVINEDECIEIVRNAASFSIRSVVSTKSNLVISIDFMGFLGIMSFSIIYLKGKDKKRRYR
ncbi:MAG: DJ-1/PfpI family protein [Promethearchaeota archaeon]